MPNFCYNTITAKNKENFEHIKTLLINDKGKVDFEKLVKMPEDVNILSPAYYRYCNEYTKEFQLNVLEPVCKEKYTSTITQEEFTQTVLNELGEKKIQEALRIYKLNHVYTPKEIPATPGLDNTIKGWFNLQRYKADSWYDWSIKYWGTKWNALDTQINEDAFKISFATAWEPPMKIVHILTFVADFTFEAYEEEEIHTTYIIAQNGNAKQINIPNYLTHFFVYDTKNYEEYKEKQYENDIELNCWPKIFQSENGFNNALQQYLNITQNPFY